LQRSEMRVQVRVREWHLLWRVFGLFRQLLFLRS
jgi:hypothetical protein